MSEPAAELADLKERLRLGRRRAALIGIAASPLMVVLGVVALFAVTKPGLGIFCIIFGAVACVGWLFLWPWGVRHGRF